jgi:hypothetical protein
MLTDIEVLHAARAMTEQPAAAGGFLKFASSGSSFWIFLARGMGKKSLLGPRVIIISTRIALVVPLKSQRVLSIGDF